MIRNSVVAAALASVAIASSASAQTCAQQHYFKPIGYYQFLTTTYIKYSSYRCDNHQWVSTDYNISLPASQCDPSCPAPPVAPPTECTAGDPFTVNNGSSRVHLADVQVAGGAGGLSLTRTYSSNHFDWIDDEPLKQVQAPFGAAALDAAAPQWWHDAFALVAITGNTWSVRDRGGHLLRFDACTAPCFAGSKAGNLSIPERLERTGTGFRLWRASGERLVFDALYTRAGIGDRYFLTEVRTPSNKVALTVNYAAPLDYLTGNPLTGCLAGTGGTSPVGTPYISELVSPEAKLKFRYMTVTRPSTAVNPGATECVLKTLTLWNHAGTASQRAAEYSYLSGAAGLLDQAKIGQDLGGGVPSVRTETYSYASNFQLTVQGGPVTTHSYSSSTGQVSADVWTGGNLSPGGWSQVSCPAGATCCNGDLPTEVPITDNAARKGDGTSGAAGLVRTVVTLDNLGQRHQPRILKSTDTCSTANACSPGSVLSEWACTSGSTPGAEIGTQDKRGNWTTKTWASVSGHGPTNVLEQTSQSWGATTKTGTLALETKALTYAYDSNNRQLPDTTTTATVLSGVAGSPDKVVKQYYDGSGRLERVITTGNTQLVGGSGTKYKRQIGTFFKFASSACSISQSSDPLDRPLEVHGPCDANATLTDCAGTAYPITVFEYWPDTNTTFNRTRLKKMTRSTDGTACTVAVATSFDNYDARGNAGTVLDVGNGITTTYTFDDDSNVTSRSIAGSAPTSYHYDNGKRTEVRHPQGNGEVFCYRTGATDDCVGGTATSQLQWQAKKACSGLPGWSCTGNFSERIDYSYAADGTLAKKEYRGCKLGGSCLGTNSADTQLRRTEVYSNDAHQRPTFSQLGDGSGSAVVVGKRGFDGADNLTAVGHPWNAPPAFCKSGSSYSILCTQLDYDRADRLSLMDQYPLTTAVRTCFDHDSQGNLTRVASGCTAGNACGGMASGAPTATTCDTASNDYVHDDFGNVIEASLGNTDTTDTGTGSKGKVYAEFDALGNVIKRQTEQQRALGVWLTYGFDQLGRLKSVDQAGAGGPVNLYTLYYDTGGVSPPNSACAGVNTWGRLRSMSDPLGNTFFQYDVKGRVVAEMRVRAGSSNCTSTGNEGNPHTFYTYSDNGNLTAITYPHGRQISYTYGSGALTDRVVAVGSTFLTAPGTWSTAVNTLVQAVEWEPYGELRGYMMVFPTSGNYGNVEYYAGTAGSEPAVQCPTSARTETSDHTGRLRALLVSTGPVLLGVGAGDIYKKSYVWTADQVTKTYSCYLNATNPIVESFGASGVAYDGVLRLKNVDGPSFASTGGPFERRKYTYDARGNRTSMELNAAANTYSFTYGAAAYQKDRLTQYKYDYTGTPSAPTTAQENTGVKYTFGYDRDGRVVSKTSPKDSSNSASLQILMGYGGPGSPGGPGAETAYRSVSVNGAQYTYWYDAFNRRRQKVFPLGVKDEYFYDLGHQMLEDRGNYNASGSGITYYPIDQYVWLGGRAIASFRNQFNSSTQQMTPEASSGSCTRLGDYHPCGVSFIVSDHIGKPVLVLDASRRIAGVGEYDPFGHVNRVDLMATPNSSGVAWVESFHPYPDSSAVYRDFSHFAHGLNMKARAHFAMLDTEQAYFGGGIVEGPSLWDGATGGFLEWLGGYHKGDSYSAWRSLNANPAGISTLRLGWSTVAGNCPPNEACSCGRNCVPPPWSYWGYAMDRYEYQRAQTSAAEFFPPFRFPGQYHDGETDFFENWNRYYDATTGRYLHPEPMLQNPGFARAMAKSGMSVPAYAYALNNPIGFVDVNGLFPLPGSPAGLPAGWSPVPHGPDGKGGPNGEQRFRHTSGQHLDFHPGRPGNEGGRDHWHWRDDKGNKNTGFEGDEMPDPPDVCDGPKATPDPDDLAERNKKKQTCPGTTGDCNPLPFPLPIPLPVPFPFPFPGRGPIPIPVPI